MFVEQRLYTCAPGNTGEFLKIYEAEGRAPQTPPSGAADRILRQRDRPAQPDHHAVGLRQPRRAGGAPARACSRIRHGLRYLDKCRPLLTTQETRILAAGAVLQGASGGDRSARERRHDRASALAGFVSFALACAAIALSVACERRAQDGYPSKADQARRAARRRRRHRLHRARDRAEALRRASASRWSSRTRAARAARSASTRWCAPRPTATRCSIIR